MATCRRGGEGGREWKGGEERDMNAMVIMCPYEWVTANNPAMNLINSLNSQGFG